MKFFAVILASIAVIAATAQAYLIWKKSDEALLHEERWSKFAVIQNYDAQQMRRTRTCEAFFQSYSDIEILVLEEDELLAEWSATEFAELQQAQNRRFSTEDLQLEEAHRRADNSLMRQYSTALRPFLSYAVSDHVYFTDEEREKLKLDDLSALPPVMRFSRSNFIRSEYSVDTIMKTKAAVRDLLAKKDPVLRLCRSVMLEAAR